MNLSVRFETDAGAPVTVGSTTVTPQSQALIFRAPVGQFVWNRPTTVLVERAGQVERIPVRDVTRMVQLGVVGLALGMTILTAAGRARRHT